jgi:glutathionylspermidine synthase
LNPRHPNLLPASFTDDLSAPYVRKPLYSREGHNVSLVTDTQTLKADGPYGAEGYVYQAAAPLPSFDDRYPVIGSWIVGDRAAGMGIREDRGPITVDSSQFVPHYFV